MEVIGFVLKFLLPNGWEIKQAYNNQLQFVYYALQLKFHINFWRFLILYICS